MADYFETVACALDPKAFSDDSKAWSADPAKHRHLVEMESRRRRVSERLSKGFGQAAANGWEVTKAVGDFQGAQYLVQGLSMNTKVMGEFVCAVIRHGGNVTGVFALHPTVKGGYVEASVKLRDSTKEAFEAETGLKLIKPTGFKLA